MGGAWLYLLRGYGSTSPDSCSPDTSIRTAESTGLPREILIVSGSRIYTSALAQLLENGYASGCSRILPGRELPEHAAGSHPDIVLVAPQSWQELERWLPCLKKCAATIPWLMLADARVVGMFLAQLEEQPCAFVDLNACPEELHSAISTVAECQCSHLSSELLIYFVRCTTHRSNRSWRRLPSVPELQCACAASLGLTNPEIATALHLAEATVKSHLHRLMQKLGRSNRQELGDLIHQLLLPESATLPMN